MEKLLDLGWKECSLDMAWKHYSKPVPKLNIWLHVDKRINHHEWSFSISYWGSPLEDDIYVDFDITVENLCAFEVLLMEIQSFDKEKIYGLIENQKVSK